MAAEGGFAGNRTGSVENIGRTVKRNVWSAIEYLIFFAPRMGSGLFPRWELYQMILTAGVPTYRGCHFF